MELGFPGTDICILNFSVASREKIEMLQSFWIPRMLNFAPNVMFVLHGMQIDLRGDGQDCMTKEQGLELAKSLGNLPYFESSAKTGEGVFEKKRRMLI